MLSPEQRERRRKSLGGSEIAAVLNIDPNLSASDVWLDKRGMVEDFKGNDLTDRGIRLEPVLVDFAEAQTGKTFLRNVMIVHRSGALHCNFDGIEAGDAPAESVEAKTTTVLEGWGAEGSDEIPDKVIAQAHQGFACVESLRVCHVPVLLPGYRSLDFRLYRVERSDEAVKIIVEASIDFMDSVKSGVQPEHFTPSLDVLKRIRREPGLVRRVSDEAAEAFIVARAARLQATKDEDAAKAALLAEMLDADGAEYGDGKMITYFQYHQDAKVTEAYDYRRWNIRAKPQEKAKSKVRELEQVGAA